jgi:MFS family permease
MRRLLSQPDFFRLWLVGGFGNATRWLEVLAAALFTYQATGSAMAVTAVTAARMLPMLVLGAFAGALSEALNRKHILVGGLLVTAMSAAAVAALAWGGALEPWHLALLAFVSGAVWASELATRRRMLGEAAGAGEIARALALDSVTNSASRMVGPVLGGLAFERIGIGGAFACTALVHLTGAALIASLGYAQQVRGFAGLRVIADIREGLAAARGLPLVLMVFAVTVVMNAFAFSYAGLLAPIGQGDFGVSPTLVGVLAAAEPFGAILGGMALASGALRLGHRMTFLGGSALFMAALALMSVGDSFALAVAMLFLGGFGTAGFSNMQSALILTEAPPAMRSRLMGVLSMCIGTQPLGVLLAGALSTRLGPTGAVLALSLSGLVCLALAFLRFGRVGPSPGRTVT